MLEEQFWLDYIAEENGIADVCLTRKSSVHDRKHQIDRQVGTNNETAISMLHNIYSSNSLLLLARRRYIIFMSKMTRHIFTKFSSRDIFSYSFSNASKFIRARCHFCRNPRGCSRFYCYHNKPLTIAVQLLIHSVCYMMPQLVDLVRCNRVCFDQNAAFCQTVWQSWTGRR